MKLDLNNHLLIFKIVQELKDRKKIRFLLSLSGAPEEEVTYFRERLDKRLVKISRVYGSGIGDVVSRIANIGA